MDTIQRLLVGTGIQFLGGAAEDLTGHLTIQGQQVVDRTKTVWESNAPNTINKHNIISLFETLQIGNAAIIVLTILYAFYSKKFRFYDLASIYGSIEFSRACGTLKKHAGKSDAYYVIVDKNSLTDQHDKDRITHEQNELFTALKADLISKSFTKSLMSLMDP